MKKLLMTMALVAAMASPAMAAHYVGVDVGTQHLNGGATNSAGLHVGANINPNVAVELGVAQSQDSNVGGVNANVLTTSVDVIGILPVVDKLDLLATAGVELQTLDATKTTVSRRRTTVTNVSDSGIGATLGAGAQYHLTDALSVRGLVKYEDVSLDAIGQDHDVKSTVGLNVAF